MSVDVRNVPPWKLALLEKKRRQEDEERRRHREEETRLSRMPAWKRDIILKKQSQKNSVVFLGKDSDKHGSDNDILAGTVTVSTSGIANSAGVADGAWELSSEAADGMAGPKVGNGHTSASEGGAAEEHLVPIQQNPWLRTDPLFKKHSPRSAHSSGSNSHDVADGYATEVVSRTNNNNEEVVFQEEQEFSYGRGFVNKLLRKFTHLSSGEKVGGNLSPKHRSLSSESLLDESKSPGQVSSASRSISTSAISAIDTIPNDRLVSSHNSIQGGNKAASMENLSPVYSSVSLDATVTSSNIDKISIDESYSEKDSLNSSSLDDNRNNAPVTFDQRSQSAYINDNDVAMEQEYPKMNFVSATRSIFEVGSIKSPTQLSSKLNIYDGITEPVLSKSDGLNRGEWSPRTASTSCNGSLGSGSEQTSLQSTPEKKAGKPVSDDALKNIRTAGKIWYSTPGDTSPVPDNDMSHAVLPAQALRPTSQTSYSSVSTSHNLTHERQEEVLSPPARKKRSAPKPPPAFAHDVSSGTKPAVPVSLDLHKLESERTFSPTHDRIQSDTSATPDSPSYKDLYFHGKSKSEASVTLVTSPSSQVDGDLPSPQVQREDTIAAAPFLKPRNLNSQGFTRPDHEVNKSKPSTEVTVTTSVSEKSDKPAFEASRAKVILDSTPRTHLVHESPVKASVPANQPAQPRPPQSPARSAVAPQQSSVPISPGSTTLISPRGDADESLSFSSAKDRFTKEAANSKVIPLPRASPVARPVPKPQPQPQPSTPPQPQPQPEAPPRRASVERPNSIVGSNSKLTLEDVKRNHFNIENNKANKLEVRKKRAKSASHSSGPGTLLIRPASNLIAVPTARTGHSTHMDKYNDVRTGVFQPPKKRPTFYGAYDDDYEDIPVTNIDDVLDDSSSMTSDTSSTGGQASSPRHELDADTHRRQISKKFDFVGAGVSLSRSLLVKTRKQKVSDVNKKVILFKAVTACQCVYVLCNWKVELLQ